jgi:ABC-type transport system involved in cytochrome c biogenesis permease subunit
MLETLCLWAGVGSYELSAVVLLWPTSGDRTLRQLPYYLLALGVALLAIAITVRWLTLAQGPFMTMYEVLLSNAFSLGLVTAIIYFWIPSARHGAVFVLPFLCMLGLWALTVSPEQVPLPPTFDNPWLWVHVLTGKLFLGTFLPAVGLACVLLFNHGLLRMGDPVIVYEPERLDLLIWRLVAVAFIFDSFMLVAGSVWAHDAWGRYWSWDPLETWALITWLALAIILHMRLTFNVPKWVNWLMLVGVLVLAFLTFFGVPFLSLIPHSGVM